jgi:hypothetical protein
VLEAGQIYCVLDQFDADQFAALGQAQVVQGGPVVVRQMPLPLRRVCACLERLVGGADRKGKGGPEAVGRAHQVAEVQGFRHPLGADGEIAARLHASGGQVR